MSGTEREVSGYNIDRTLDSIEQAIEVIRMNLNAVTDENVADIHEAETRLWRVASDIE